MNARAVVLPSVFAATILKDIAETSTPMVIYHLKLVKEIQIRNYNGLIGHTSLVMARYNNLSLFQRKRFDQQSFGDLFKAAIKNWPTELSLMR
jgi:hypothetical protein